MVASALPPYTFSSLNVSSFSSFCFKDIFDPWKELVLPGIDLYIKSDTMLNVLNSAEDAEVAIIYGIYAILTNHFHPHLFCLCMTLHSSIIIHHAILSEFARKLEIIYKLKSHIKVTLSC